MNTFPLFTPDLNIQMTDYINTLEMKGKVVICVQIKINKIIFLNISFCNSCNSKHTDIWL